MTLEEQLKQLSQENEALIAGGVKPDMGPINAASNIPDEETLALQKLQRKNDMLLAGKDESTGSSFMDYLAGFNFQVGKAIPPLINAVQGVFTPGKNELFPNTKMRDDVILDAMRSIGIEAKDIDTLANRIGQQNFHDLLVAAATIAGAPVAAGAAGTGAVSRTVQTIGKTIMSRPGLATAETLGAGAGQQIAEEAAPDSPIAGFAGAIGGSLAVGAGAATGRKAVNAANVIARNTPGLKNIPGLNPPVPATAIRPYEADPEQARLFAEQAVEGARMQMQKAADDAIEAVPRVGRSDVLQAQTRASIDRAERIGNRIVSSFWERVDLTRPVPMQPIRNAVRQLQAELADTPASAPTDFLERLHKLSMPIRAANGQMVPSLPTIRRLRDFRAEVRRARIAEQAAPAPNDALIRNYNKVEGIIDEGIQSAYPNDRAIDQARKVSILYHDMFTRSEVGKVLRTDAVGNPIVPPERTVSTLMSRPGGLQDVQDVRNKLAYKRAPGGASFAVTPAERSQLQQLTTDAENSIRAMFREAAMEGGPEGAAKFVGKHLGSIEAAAPVHAELAMAGEKIGAALRSQKAIGESAIAKYASSNPTYSFKRIWGQANPVATAKQVLLTLNKDANALMGFRASAIDDLMARTGGDPIRVRNLLHDPRTDALYRTVLGDESYNRLIKLNDIAYRIAIGDEGFVTRHLISRVTLLGRIIGAQVGRVVSNMLGGGTIQVPGLMASSFGRGVENMLRTANPRDLLVFSIIDPKWERLLLTRDPRSTIEGRKALKAMRRALTAIEFTQQRAHDALANENEQ